MHVHIVLWWSVFYLYICCLCVELRVIYSQLFGALCMAAFLYRAVVNLSFNRLLIFSAANFRRVVKVLAKFDLFPPRSCRIVLTFVLPWQRPVKPKVHVPVTVVKETGVPKFFLLCFYGTPCCSCCQGFEVFVRRSIVLNDCGSCCHFPTAGTFFMDIV